MGYTILKTVINFDSQSENVMLNVAIESSPGRYKAYQKISCQKHIGINEIKDCAAYGRKLTEQEVRLLFPKMALKHEG